MHQIHEGLDLPGMRSAFPARRGYSGVKGFMRPTEEKGVIYLYRPYLSGRANHGLSAVLIASGCDSMG